MKVIDLAIMGRFRFKKFFSEYDKEDKQIAIEVLKDLGIDHLREKDFLSLSGGEQQLVWLAQLLVQDTDISLLDEPTQQLDLYNKKKIFYQMQKWVAEKGKTVICVTHDIMNLYNMQGYFLNFSENKPALKELNRSNLDESIKELLDEKKAWDPEDLI
jgi:iron complex transport system ATP-binding protein